MFFGDEGEREFKGRGRGGEGTGRGGKRGGRGGRMKERIRREMRLRVIAFV